MFSNSFILILALLFDRFFGDPDWLWHRLPHPVVGFGKVIEKLEARLWDGAATPEKQRENGKKLIVALVGGAALLGWFLDGFLDGFWLIGDGIELLIVAVFLAQKSLADHAEAVLKGFRDDGLEGARKPFR